MHKNIDIIKVNLFPEYDILYCDPPWEDRMVKFFQTQLKKDTGLIVENDIDVILNKLAFLANCNKPAFVEYSILGTDRVISHFQNNGHKHIETILGHQKNGLPYNIISFNTSFKLPENPKGFNSVSYVVKGLKPNVVFDPFAGIGKTAEAVYKSGASYIGYELNPKRYEKLMKVISKYESI